jgi:hypothetical protein
MYCTVQLIDCDLHIFFSTDPVKLDVQSVIFDLVRLLRPQQVVVTNIFIYFKNIFGKYSYLCCLSESRPRYCATRGGNPPSNLQGLSWAGEKMHSNPELLYYNQVRYTLSHLATTLSYLASSKTVQL